MFYIQTDFCDPLMLLAPPSLAQCVNHPLKNVIFP